MSKGQPCPWTSPPTLTCTVQGPPWRARASSAPDPGGWMDHDREPVLPVAPVHLNCNTYLLIDCMFRHTTSFACPQPSTICKWHFNLPLSRTDIFYDDRRRSPVVLRPEVICSRRCNRLQPSYLSFLFFFGARKNIVNMEETIYSTNLEDGYWVNYSSCSIY